MAGVDEAGRGPLAGPVVAAAVILPVGCSLPEVRDSKQLSPSSRRRCYQRILEVALAIGVGEASPEEIDRWNILQASFLAMRRALENLPFPPEIVVVDGRSIPELPYPQVALPKADTRSLSCASASIIAKVLRDELMVRLDQEFPGYGFAHHKGYPTREHLEALQRLGPSSLHRRSFQPVKQYLLP